MLNSTIVNKFFYKLKTPLIIFFWLIVWQGLSRIINQELLLVSPVQVLVTLSHLIWKGSFWSSIGLSLWHILLGFGWAMLIGGVLALLAARWSIIHDFLYPLFSVIKATPVASFIILALIWVKGQQLSTFTAFLMVVPIAYTNLYQGLQSVDPKLLEVGKVFNLTPMRMMRTIYIPTIMPFVLSSCTVGLGLAWKSGVAAEVIGLPNNSIGMHLYDAKIYLETPDLFAWTTMIVLLSVVMEKMLIKFINYIDAKIKVIF